MHPIVILQSALVTALGADAALAALIGADAVFDAPPVGRNPPYVVIDRHDVRARDGDLAPGLEHRVLLVCWSDQPSRKAALAVAERVVAVGIALVAGSISVTHAEHVRTETVVEDGRARAAVLLRFFSE